jgi:hypothetical protein
MLDDILDDIAEKKGIQKEQPQNRPNTAKTPKLQGGNDLDDLMDEPGSSAKGSFLNKSQEPHQRSNDEILQRKKSLFGVQPSPNNTSVEIN